MAELKRNFLKSRMNKDLDERLISNGEYRDATNIEITTSESSQTGTVQTLSGNTKWENNISKGSENNAVAANNYTSAQTVGYYNDDENNAIYNFVAGASDLRIDEVATDFYNYVGVKSDLIEQITPHKTDPSSTITKVVFNDVYEARVVPREDSVTNNKIIGIATRQCYLSSTNDLFRSASGIRVGMRVQLVAYDGTDAWGASNEIYVTGIDISANGFASISITPVAGVTTAYTATNRSEGLVLKFSAPRILNFKKGSSKELESNVDGGEVTFTPSNSYISAINVIDDFLFWTDGRNEPKKINIKRFIAGSSMVEKTASGAIRPISKASSLPHTRLVVEAENKMLALAYAKEEHVTVIRPNPNCSMKAIGTVAGLESLPTNVPIYGRTPGSEEPFAPFAFSSNTNVLFTSEEDIEIKPQISLANEWVLGTQIRLTGQTSSSVVVVKVNSISEDSEEEAYYTVSIQGELPDGYLGTTADEVWLGQQLPKENLYTDDFIRFAYRYKYVDGEYSCISPYTQPVFLPGNYSYSPKDGFNIGMENTLDKIELSQFVNPDIPHDVVEVELLFKSQKSDNVYAFTDFKIEHSVITQKQVDGTEDYEPQINDNYSISEKLFGYTLPSDQLTRNFDAVPKRSVAQEIMANRLMYANYTQDYNLIDEADNTVKLELNTQTTQRTVNYGSGFNSVDILTASQVQEGEGTTVDYYLDNSAVGGEWISRSIIMHSEYDPGNNFSLGSAHSSYTAPTTGYYILSAFARVEGFHDSNPVGDAVLVPRKFKIRITILNGAVNVDGVTSLGNDDLGALQGVLESPLQDRTDFESSDINDVASSQYGVSSIAVYYDYSNYDLTIPETSVYLTAGDTIGLVAVSPEAGAPTFTGGRMHVTNASFKVLEAPAATYTLPNKKGFSSIKSIRNYSLGVVYRDKFGRESSVLTGDYEDLNVPKSNAELVQSIITDIRSNAPRWAKTY